jgi:DNA polymerase V
MPPAIFHIDGNSFYASCERVFRPDLYKSPIAVFSNNDGIIIALNAECKALGFKRGDAFFENRHKLKKANVSIFSSNYTLYADMSARMNLIYNRFAPEVEVYSIDESFLFFPAWKNCSYTEIAAELKQAVTRETGIPVSIGIAPTKTLAKMCNKLAKKNTASHPGNRDGMCQSPGICNWHELDKDSELANYPAGDIWGVGYSKTALLKKQGITTALQLKHYPLHKAKKHLTIAGMRTVQELNEIAAIDRIEEAPRQIIMVSRSFQTAVFDIEDIITALAVYTQEAVKRMRSEGLSCKYVSVYLMTNAFAQGEQYFNQLSAKLPCATASLPEITAAAIELLKKVYRPNYKYRKVMIGLTGLCKDSNPLQLDLFNTVRRDEKAEPLMQVFDKINDRYGRGTLKLGCGLGKKLADNEIAPWAMKRDYLSPMYTTNIKDIPRVH